MTLSKPGGLPNHRAYTRFWRFTATNHHRSSRLSFVSKGAGKPCHPDGPKEDRLWDPRPRIDACERILGTGDI